MVAQALYLKAEATGLQGTAMGFFFVLAILLFRVWMARAVRSRWYKLIQIGSY